MSSCKSRCDSDRISSPCATPLPFSPRFPVETYWDNRIEPFWRHVWPKSRGLASEEIADDLARICIVSGSRFPNALHLMLAWLRPIKHSDYIVHLLHESKLCPRFPDDALALLDAVINIDSWPPSNLGARLEAIASSNPMLADDQRFIRLMTYWRRRGG